MMKMREDCVLQKTPFSFDVSVRGFFWPLMTGTQLAIVKLEGHKDTAYLCSLIEREQVTTIHFVPSMLQVFLEDAGVAKGNSLRYVICSGEALPFELQQTLFRLFSARLPARTQAHPIENRDKQSRTKSCWRSGAT